MSCLRSIQCLPRRANVQIIYSIEKVTMKCLIIFMCIVALVLAKPGLDPDNKSHRGFSNSLDRRFGNNRLYNNFARPVVHGAYHAGRFVNSRNPEEWARSKDQFSKFGTGQQQSDYLRAHRKG